ncbi:MAG: hypothetical protein COW65_15220 [Cytophagales bacterium CG18_big_fil_WC_8_21_14_2_50_42_9]|nr:MAG: hypothetical protein COW65_15220 [Cytophagales bacterium CG18_big_fil_WC_8_21_14_2_50_42_9]
MEHQLVLLCVSCNRKIQAGIFNDDFTSILFKILLLLFLLLPLLITYYRSLATSAGSVNQTPAKKAPVVVFSLCLGIGMGGFIDGIVLHQILQWHQMLSNQIIPNTFETKSINMFWDGIFEAVTWVFTFIGILLLWQSRRRPDLHLSNLLFTGGLIAGWGIFNLMDSIFNHYLFRFHNVRENVAEVAAWNLGFLILSLAMILLGGLMMKQVRNQSGI